MRLPQRLVRFYPASSSEALNCIHMRRQTWIFAADRGVDMIININDSFDKLEEFFYKWDTEVLSEN